jgi:tetratricopeptide (TPR) repeat protein
MMHFRWRISRQHVLSLVKVLAAMLFLGCASQSKKGGPPLTLVTSDHQKEFQNGVDDLDRGDYEEAAKIFDRLLLEKPGAQLDLVTLYNSGAAYEGLGNCHEAGERYRRVVRSSANAFREIQSQALFRLSLMYECLGQDPKAVAALLDAKRRGSELPEEVLSAQIPARLAAAYARLGNRAKATEFFNQANLGLKSVVARGVLPHQVEELTRTMYLMGQLSPSQRQANVAPRTFMQSLTMQQPYLLQAIEMNNSHWSPKAEDDLRTAYDNIWRFQFDDSKERRNFYLRCREAISELRKIRMPGTRNRSEVEIFALLDKTENRLQMELANVETTNPLTPEADRRQGLRQPGRLVDPHDKKTHE